MLNLTKVPAPLPSGVETKVVAAGGYGIAALLATWFLTTAFHVHLPAYLATMLPGLVAWVVGTGAAWMAKHTPRTPAPAPVVMAPVPGHAGDVPAAPAAP